MFTVTKIGTAHSRTKLRTDTEDWLHKPELYDAFKYALFEDASPLSIEYIYYRQQQHMFNDFNIQQQQRLFYSSSKSINFMHQKKLLN